MPVALHIRVRHILYEPVPLLHLYDEQMEDRLRISGMDLHLNQGIGNLSVVASPDFLASGRPLRQVFQAHGQHCPLQPLQTIIISDLVMIIGHIAALVLQPGHMPVMALVLTGDAAALPEGVQVLAGIEAEAGDIAQSAHIPSLEFRAVGLCTVLRHEEAVPVRNGPGARIVKGLPVQMDAQDAPGPWRDPLLQQGRIQLPGIRRAVHEHRRGPGIADPPCRGDIGVGRYDDLVPRPYAQRQHGQVQRGGAVVHAAGVRDSYVFREFPVKGIRVLPAGKGSVPADPFNGLQVLLPVGIIVPGQIDAFDVCAHAASSQIFFLI